MQQVRWLTVITVVKNDAEGFSRTLHSLEHQSFADFEFIVIDSSDDLDEIPSILRTTGIQTKYTWIRPAGVYPAMNEGISQATGQYCYFANAGDTLYSNDVLALARTSARSAPTWLFGPVEIVSETGERVITPYWNYQREKSQCFSRGLFPCHQGTFVHTGTLRELGGFSSNFEIVSDYAMFLELSRIEDPVELDFVVASFVEGGISTVRWRDSLNEFHSARITILRPHGRKLLRELWNTGVGFVRMLAYRSFLSKMRRRVS